MALELRPKGFSLRVYYRKLSGLVIGISWKLFLKIRRDKLEQSLVEVKSGLDCGRIKAKQIGGKLSQGVQALGKHGLCSGHLARDCYKEDPLSTGHLNGPDCVEP